MDTDKKGNGLNRSGTGTVCKIVYGILAMLTGLSYWVVRSFVIAQEPPSTPIIVSNLTLNLVLFVLLVGAFVPFVTRRFFSRAYKRMLVPTAIVIGVILILLLRTLGMEMRF